MIGIDREDIISEMTYTVTSKNKAVPQDVLALIVKQINSNKALLFYNSNYKIIKITANNGIVVSLGIEDESIESEESKTVFANSIVNDLYKNFNSIENILNEYFESIKEKVENKKKPTDNDKKLLKIFKDGYKIIPEDSNEFKSRITTQIKSSIYDIEDYLDEYNLLWDDD